MISIAEKDAPEEILSFCNISIFILTFIL